MPAHDTHAQRQREGVDALIAVAQQTDSTVVMPAATWPEELARRQYARSAPHRRPSRWQNVKRRLLVIQALVICTAAIYAAQRLLWPSDARPQGGGAAAWSDASLLWLVPLVPALFEVVGLLMYRRTPGRVRPIGHPVCWRIVSRGTNTEALISTIGRCRQEMRRTPVFPYIIEVVTDEANPALPPSAIDLRYLTVPSSYQTRAGSLYKARALQYALETSPLPDTAWIVHLDEETHPTRSGIEGVARMIREEEETGELRIGQGAILYHRDWRAHPFLTLADMIRTGNDLGRYHFAHRTGVTIFGLHGSYIVVRNDVEKEIGFDFGPQGSITEDAFWALVGMETGLRCRWVDGYLEEQSTRSVMDFIKQRRRWFQGIIKVARYAPVRFRWRFALAINTVLWTLAPVTLAYTVAHFVTGGYVNPVVRALANVAFAVFVVTSLAGLRVNLTEHGIRNPIKRAAWGVLWLACMPLFSLLEAAAVVYAVASPSRGFHVVKK